MKIIWLLLLFKLAYLVWRSRIFQDTLPPSTSKPAPPPQVTDMVSCAVCHVYMPVAQALKGQRGSYCCLDHLQQSEPS